MKVIGTCFFIQFSRFCHYLLHLTQKSICGVVLVYFEDMMKLQGKAPNVYQAFVEEMFVVKRSKGKFNTVVADMALDSIPFSV